MSSNAPVPLPRTAVVIGLAAGYVLGSRAGRERYEQIKDQAIKLWELEPVQDQVDKVKDFTKSAAMALPSTLWNSAVKVTKAANSSKGGPVDKLSAAVKAGKGSGAQVAKAAETSAEAVKDAAEDVIDGVSQTTSKTSTSKPATKTTPRKSTGA